MAAVDSEELTRARQRHTLATRQLAAMQRLGASAEVLEYHSERVRDTKHDLILLQPLVERLQALLDSERSRVSNLEKFVAQYDAAEQALAAARNRRDHEAQLLAAVRVELLQVQAILAEAASKARAPQSAGGSTQPAASAQVTVPANATVEDLLGFLEQIRLMVAARGELDRVRPGASAPAEVKRQKVDEQAPAAVDPQDVPMADPKPISAAGSAGG